MGYYEITGCGQRYWVEDEVAEPVAENDELEVVEDETVSVDDVLAQIDNKVPVV